MPASRRYRDAALLVPLGGLLLFMPPYLQIMNRADHLFGIPVLHVYIFTIWFIGIVLTAAISRRLAGHMAAEAAAERRKGGEKHADQT